MNQINRHWKFLFKKFEVLKIPVVNGNLLFFTVTVNSYTL